MGNSPLVTYTSKSPCTYGKRTAPIERITIHVYVGQVTVERIGKSFDHASAYASCNYGIGTDGAIMLCVDEDMAAQTSSSEYNDQRAVTMECASDTTHPYKVNDKVWESILNLCTDIAKRNDKDTIVWFSDCDTALAYKPRPNELLLTVHRWFASRACPGDYLFNRMGDIAEIVTNRLQEADVRYAVQVGSYKNRNYAEILLQNLQNAGFDGYITKKVIERGNG